MSNAEARFNKSLRPRKPEGSLGRTAQDVGVGGGGCGGRGGGCGCVGVCVGGGCVGGVGGMGGGDCN